MKVFSLNASFHFVFLVWKKQNFHKRVTCTAEVLGWKTSGFENLQRKDHFSWIIADWKVDLSKVFFVRRFKEWWFWRNNDTRNTGLWGLHVELLRRWLGKFQRFLIPGWIDPLFRWRDVWQRGIFCKCAVLVSWDSIELGVRRRVVVAFSAPVCAVFRALPAFVTPSTQHGNASQRYNACNNSYDVRIEDYC